MPESIKPYSKDPEARDAFEAVQVKYFIHPGLTITLTKRNDGKWETEGGEVYPSLNLFNADLEQERMSTAS